MAAAVVQTQPTDLGDAPAVGKMMTESQDAVVAAAAAHGSCRLDWTHGCLLQQDDGRVDCDDQVWTAAAAVVRRHEAVCD